MWKRSKRGLFITSTAAYQLFLHWTITLIVIGINFMLRDWVINREVMRGRGEESGTTFKIINLSYCRLLNKILIIIITRQIVISIWRPLNKLYYCLEFYARNSARVIYLRKYVFWILLKYFPKNSETDDSFCKSNDL